MREVAPGDLIFSFVDTRIVAIGIAESYCSELPKPEEFGKAGANWGNAGWCIRVRFGRLVGCPGDTYSVVGASIRCGR
jgi:hypothetical protein